MILNAKYYVLANQVQDGQGQALIYQVQSGADAGYSFEGQGSCGLKILACAHH